MNQFNLRWCASFFAVGIVASSIQVARAEQWPDRAVTVVVPYAAGGNTDNMARMAAERLTKALGKPFVIENRGGGGGTIAADYVARSKPDGYTLFFGTLTQISTAPFTNKIRYDPVKDFVPIANVGGNPFVITVNTQRPFKTLVELVKYGKENPAKLNVGNAGVGGLTHLSAILFLHRAGITATMIPYKGASLALTDVITGQLDFYSGNLSEALPHAKGGKVSLLAVSSAQRVKQLPNVPTIAETYPGHTVETWNGFLGPAAMPPEIVDKIAGEMKKIHSQPDFQAKLEDAGITPLPEFKQEFAQRIQNDIAKWKPIILGAGIKPE